MSRNNVYDMLVIGGGAAGFFAAITCAETNPGMQVVILEKGKEVLQKVKVSGGGRCNVTHACFEPAELVKHYPRGNKALLGPFHRFSPADAVAWFEGRGVKLKTEADGRMFPTSNKSQTIIDCLVNSAKQASVAVLTGQNVCRLEPPGEKEDCWKVETQQGKLFEAKKVMIATGNSPRIWEILATLGHRIVSPVPSLFTFNIKDERLAALPGVSVPRAALQVSGEKLRAEGALLITHWGLSGPAILRLSAWGARKLHARDYRFDLEINWLSNQEHPDILETVNRARIKFAKNSVEGYCPFPLPNRLWKNLVKAAGILPETKWADLGREEANALAQQISQGNFKVNGKSTFKDEFVTAGGVHLDDIDFRRFESKICPGLFLAGEVLDIDAITGGFNFQAAWTGGWIAGQAMGK
jgi:hypothetical protein